MNSNYNIKSESPANYTSTVTTSLSDDDIVKTAIDILTERVMRSGDVLSSPEAAKKLLSLRLGFLEHEVFGIMTLTTRNEVISIKELFRGTVDGASVYPREVMKEVLKDNASAVILYHNHPSGDSSESSADITITKRLKEALSFIDVKVLDHMIVGGPRVLSFAEKGLI